jgi:hypothetical protein
VLTRLAFEVEACWGPGGATHLVSKACLQEKLIRNFQFSFTFLVGRMRQLDYLECRFGGSFVLSLVIACCLVALEY